MRHRTAAVIISCLTLSTGCQPMSPVLVATPPPLEYSLDTFRACVGREGHCFHARVNGQDLIPLTSRDPLEPYRASTEGTRKEYLEAARWTSGQPVRGELRIEAAPNAIGRDWFGDQLEVDVRLIALGDARIRVRREVTTNENLLLGGRPVSAVDDVLADDTLPPGAYVFRIDLRGSRNWDRKFAFLRVE